MQIVALATATTAGEHRAAPSAATAFRTNRTCDFRPRRRRCGYRRRRRVARFACFFPSELRTKKVNQDGGAPHRRPTPTPRRGRGNDAPMSTGCGGVAPGSGNAAAAMVPRRSNSLIWFGDFRSNTALKSVKYYLKYITISSTRSRRSI